MFTLLTLALTVNADFKYPGKVPQDSDVPIPTNQQIQYMDNEIAALIHFNMATYGIDGDPGCNAQNWNQKDAQSAGPTSDPMTFNPAKLDITQWAVSMKALGAKHAIITAKHGCGHLLWPTKVTLPGGREYIYAVGHSQSAYKHDILFEYVTTMRAHGIGAGLYYSLGNNFYLNMVHDTPGKTILPKQENVTKEEFGEIVIGHFTELMTKYGDLFEIWFDHGIFNFGDNITELVNKYQPNAVGMNGYGVVKHPVCWIGNERGASLGDVWLTGTKDGDGDPNSTVACPRCVDTYVQHPFGWFYMNRTADKLGELIKKYHSSVGKNGVLELAFSIDRTGMLVDNHVQAYKKFGDWIRNCYGKPLATMQGLGSDFKLQVNAKIDRLMIEEDIRYGQRIRNYTLYYTEQGSAKWQPWPLLGYFGTPINVSSVGHKRILVNNVTNTVGQLWLKVTVAKGTPVVQFSAYSPCPSGYLTSDTRETK